MEEQWNENYLTTAGILMHSRAHNENLIEKRGDIITIRGMRISSSVLGISGQCDVVEFCKDKTGITLNKYDGYWQVFPVEYKHGIEKIGDEDRLQLCAQAMCLEEMLAASIDKGYLYYGKDKQREEVILDEDLREKVTSLIQEMHEAYQTGNTPKVNYQKKCISCSLKDVCLPKLSKSKTVEKYIEESMDEKTS